VLKDAFAELIGKEDTPLPLHVADAAKWVAYPMVIAKNLLIWQSYFLVVLEQALSTPQQGSAMNISCPYCAPCHRGCTQSIVENILIDLKEQGLIYHNRKARKYIAVPGLWQGSS
jgi:hypothetical protein